MIIWITGPQGSGKSTLASKLLAHVKVLSQKHVLQIDGDEIRQRMHVQLGYSKEHRDIMTSVYVALAESVSSQDSVVLVSTVSNRPWIFERLRDSTEDCVIIRLRVTPEMAVRARPNLYKDDEMLAQTFSEAEFPIGEDLELWATTDLEREEWLEVVSKFLVQKFN